MHASRHHAMLATATAGLLALTASPAALAAGHAETIAAFDTGAGEVTEGVAVGPEGEVYTGLSLQGQLVRLDADGGHAPLGAVEGLAEGDFGLLGMEVADDGSVIGAVFSTNPEAHGVWRFDVDAGTVERLAGTEAIAFPNDVDFGDDGTVYVSDTITGAVWRVPPGAAAEPWLDDDLLKGTGAAGFPFPIGANGIAVHDGTVYVGVTETAQVVAIPIESDGSAGEPSTFVQLPEAVDGVAVDAEGDVYATHPLANLVTRTTPAGEISVIGEVGDGLDAPSSVAIGDGIVYVANFSVGMGGEMGNGPSIVALDVSG